MWIVIFRHLAVKHINNRHSIFFLYWLVNRDEGSLDSDEMDAGDQYLDVYDYMKAFMADRQIQWNLIFNELVNNLKCTNLQALQAM